MSTLSLLELTKLRGHDREVGIIESVVTAAPELEAIPGRTIKGTIYKTVDRTSLPNVGFTNANEGIAAGKSGFTMKQVECYIFRAGITVDKAIAMDYEDGPAALQAIEAQGVGRAAGIALGSQVYYGTTKDGKGFPGLKDIVTSTTTVTSPNAASSGAGTSVYALKFGPQYVQMIYGGGTTIQLPAFRDQSITDANGGQYDAFISNLTAWVGLQCVHPYAVGRIKGLGTTTGASANTLNDSVIADLLATFPVGFAPDALFMSRQSRSQLQKSRSVVLMGNGKASSIGGEGGVIAPIPTEAFGIKIICTDNISNSEV